MADLHTAEKIGNAAPLTDLPADLDHVLQRAYQAFGCRSSFRGVDIGYRWTDGRRTNDICLRLHLQRKLPDTALLSSQRLPSHVDGIPLDVIEAAYQPSLEPGATRRPSARQPYTMGGLSCGRTGQGAGTIGLVVIDKTNGKPGILSNWHVLAGPGARRNDPIMLLGEQGDEFDPRNHIANLKRWMLDREGDAALAELLPDQPWLPLQFGALETISKTRSAQLGEILQKTSRCPNTARARVDGKGLYRLQYETRPGVLEYRDIAGLNLVYDTDIPAKDGRTFAAGDSGAAWIAASTGEAVALQVGGQIPPSQNTGRAGQGIIACEVTPILERLEVRLASFEDLLAQNGQSATLTQRQRTYADLSHDTEATLPSAQWPHPQHWADAAATRPERTEITQSVGQVVPMIRIRPNARLPLQGGLGSTSRQFSIKKEIWQDRLYPALVDYDVNFQGVLLDEAISQRISAMDARTIHAFFALLINTSSRFGDIGLKQVLGSDFQGATSYLQICERIFALRADF